MSIEGLELYFCSICGEVWHVFPVDHCESLIKCEVFGLTVPAGAHDPDCHRRASYLLRQIADMLRLLLLAIISKAARLGSDAPKARRVVNALRSVASGWTRRHPHPRRTAPPRAGAEAGAADRRAARGPRGRRRRPRRSLR